MSYKDLMHGNQRHEDSPEQAAARRAAEAEARARAEAKAGKHAGRGTQQRDPAKREDPSSK
jgi:hypothetical protein